MIKKNETEFFYLTLHYFMKSLKEVLKNEISAELKKEINGFLQALNQESVSYEEANQIYEKIMLSYQKECLGKSEMQNKMLSLHVHDTYLELSKRFQNASLLAFQSGDMMKEQALFQTHEKVVELMKRIATLPNPRGVLNLLGKITYLSDINDTKILHAIQNNQNVVSQVYLKKTDYEWDNREFSVLVNENGEDYMVSFQEDGAVYLKDPVQLVDCYPWDPGQKEIASKINQKLYFSLSELAQTDLGKQFILDTMQHSHFDAGANSILDIEERLRHCYTLYSGKNKMGK